MADHADQIERVEIDFLILADRAESVNGKLYMMGGAWDRLHVADFEKPVALCIAIGVLVPWNYANEEHPLTLVVESEDGEQVVAPLQVNLNVGRPPESIKGQAFRAILAVQGVWKIPRPGTYVVSARVGEQESKRTRSHAIGAPVPRAQ